MNKNRICFKEVIEDSNDFKFIDYLLKITNGMVAGGCFKDIYYGKSPKDFDVYFKNNQDLSQAIQAFHNLKYGVLYETKNVIAFGVPDYVNGSSDNNLTSIRRVELVKSIIGDFDEIIHTFDFTICKMGYYLENNRPVLIEKDGAVGDILSRKFKIANFKNNPIGILTRVVKYSNYGYKIDNNQLGKLIFEIIKQCLPHLFNIKDFIKTQLNRHYYY